MRIAPMAALHIAIMCLARRSARDRMLLHQETAACGSNALAHADASLMATLTRYRSKGERTVTKLVANSNVIKPHIQRRP
jgi:hypothetical protein